MGKPCDGCRDKQCAPCHYQRSKPKYAKRLGLMESGKPWLKAGLKAGPSGKEWFLGCLVCRAACRAARSMTGSRGTAWSRFEVDTITAFQMCDLLKHENRLCHQLASSSQRLPQPQPFPTADDFDKVLCAREKHQSLEAGVAGVAGRKKMKRMQFCLAEARRAMARLALRKAATIVLHQDGRSPRLLTRFVACSPQLVVTHGCLPHAKHYRPDYRSVAASTLESIQIFCTPFYGAPQRSQVQLGQLDRELEGHIKISVEVLSADAAASQQAVPDTVHEKLNLHMMISHTVCY